MASNGKVIGGAYMDAVVTVAPFGSGIVIQGGLRWRKVNTETVTRWQEVPLESRGAKTASAVGQAVAEAVLPRFLSRGASAAIGASIDSSTRVPHGVRVEWSDDKPPSLLKLPDDLFAHFELVLGALREEPPADLATGETTVAVVTTASATPDAPQTLTEQAFSMVSSLIKERTRPSDVTPDVAEQLVQLASLRDAGVLTEAEFTTKKAELLARM